MLQFDSTTTSGTNVQLSHRYLWGPRVDYQLSDEQLPVTNGEGVTRIVWPLTDHLGTVRDLVEYTTFTSGTPRTMLLKHRTYDSFGNLLGEYNRGDFDHDGDIDAEDIDSMLWAASQGVFGQYNGYDINGDGVVNSADTSAFVLDVIGTVFGDADMDGVCDGGDFAIWNINKFQTGDFGWAGADFNGDGAVDGGDWTILNANMWTGDGDLNTRVVDHLFGFTGRLIDSATGLQNNLNRWYDAGVGRWTGEDPIGFAARDANLYRYVNNSPTNAIDPNGLFIGWIINEATGLNDARREGNRLENERRQTIRENACNDPNGPWNDIVQDTFRLSADEAALIGNYAETAIEANAALLGGGGLRPGGPHFKDPTIAPDGYEWRGKPGSKPGSKEGNYFNPGTGETLRPDLSHPGPIGPHWDYRDSNGKWWRIFPDGRKEPK